MDKPNATEKMTPAALDRLMSPPVADRFQTLILKRTGMLMPPRRREAMVHAVEAESGRSAAKDLEAYYRLLQETGTDGALWENLLAHLAIGETYFFRDKLMFNALRRHILPGLIHQHRKDRHLRIWSAGCSTGEEIYSVAIELCGLLPDPADWNLLILGTDINRQALRRARKGRYSKWSFREPGSEKACKRYFKKTDGLYEIDPRIRKMVTFTFLNLTEDDPASLAHHMDLILCRNVIIHIHSPLIDNLIDRFHCALRPGGWLALGPSEGMRAAGKTFSFHNFSGTIFHRKRSPDCGLPVAPPFASGSAQTPVNQNDRPPPPPLAHTKPSGPLSGHQPSPAERAYRQGMAMMEQKHYEQAIRCFSACIRQNPDFAPACYQMARSLANRGRLKEAGAWCRKAIGIDPLAEQAHYTLALICQESGELEEAVTELKRALYLKSDFALAHFSLSAILAKMGRTEQASRHRFQAIRTASTMKPDAPVPGSDGLRATDLIFGAK